ncbi:MAG: succinyl-diaminopimelate desuccinylase [Gammaproteobacteria bacterium]|nr:succinyl-diaminopimelate desuccinylase [Gammaproteobacteria bacterium]
MTQTLELLKELIACPSVTPHDAGCQSIIKNRLEQAGFHVEEMHSHDVQNLWARYGDQSPLIVFAGHTDVVPPGPLDAWHSDPFTPTIRDGHLYGRGATDMKTGLAAMIVAAENFIRKNPSFLGSIGFLVTSDEEGPSVHGTRHVIEILENRNEKIDYCVIGEAGSYEKLGDTIRVGRRGSLQGHLTVYGKQGHIAYPDKTINPIHQVAPAIVELTATEWDNGNAFFPPTTFQFSNIHAGTGAKNVVPGRLECDFNFRFSTAVTPEVLKERVLAILEKHQLKFDLEWEASAHPFLTEQGKLLDAVEKAILETTGLETIRSTAGGTSDGRFIAPTGAEVIEVGPLNETAHKVNESIALDALEPLTEIYEKTLTNIFCR